MGWRSSKYIGIDLVLDVCPNWAAGGTIWVNKEGLLEAYATEHKPGGGDLDVLSWRVP